MISARILEYHSNRQKALEMLSFFPYFTRTSVHNELFKIPFVAGIFSQCLRSLQIASTKVVGPLTPVLAQRPIYTSRRGSQDMCPPGNARTASHKIFVCPTHVDRHVEYVLGSGC